MKTQTTEQLENNANQMDYTKSSSTDRLHQVTWIGDIKKHPLAYLSLSDLISLHGWIDSEADLIETLGGDYTAKLEQAREQMILVHQEIEKRRSMLFGGK